jgi:hypothetical protein
VLPTTVLNRRYKTNHILHMYISNDQVNTTYDQGLDQTFLSLHTNTAQMEQRHPLITGSR